MKTFPDVGGTSGIGLETVKQLHSGCDQIIVLSCIATAPPFSERYVHLSDEIPDIGIDTLDELIYALGTINLKPFHRITYIEFLRDWQVNILGAAKLLRHFLPQHKKSGSASVVLVIMVAVQTRISIHASIAMAKGAIEGLTWLYRLDKCNSPIFASPD